MVTDINIEAKLSQADPDVGMVIKAVMPSNRRGPSCARVRDNFEPHRHFPLRSPIFFGAAIRLGSRADASGGLISGMPVGTRPARLPGTLDGHFWGLPEGVPFLLGSLRPPRVLAHP
jgi:hypothetical protein